MRGGPARHRRRSPAAHNNLALTHAGSGRHGGARGAFLAAGDAAAASYNIGIVYLADGRFAEAGESVRAAIVARPAFTAAKTRAHETRMRALTSPTMEDQHEAYYADSAAALGLPEPAGGAEDLRRGRPDARPAHSALFEDPALRRRVDGRRAGQAPRLNFSVIEPALDVLKTQRQIEIGGGTMVGPRLIPVPHHRRGPAARCAVPRIQPLRRRRSRPFDQYPALHATFHEDGAASATRERVREAFSHLVISQPVLDQLGPAINAGHSMFVYGPPATARPSFRRPFASCCTARSRFPMRSRSRAPSSAFSTRSITSRSRRDERSDRAWILASASISAGSAAGVRWSWSAAS